MHLILERKNKNIFLKKFFVLVTSLAVQAALFSMLNLLNYAYAEILTNNLTTEIQSGRVSIERIEGNGGSTGTVLNGQLVNKTVKEINLDVYLSDALYLVNSGSGQNMFVLGVLGKSGRYSKSGNKSFITLPSKKRTPVVFLSYCADFAKENPTPDESFEVGPLPENIRSLLRRISAYHEQYPDKDVTRAAQLAIWFAQGETASEIKKKFNFTQNDLNMAYYFNQKNSTKLNNKRTTTEYPQSNKEQGLRFEQTEQGRQDAIKHEELLKQFNQVVPSETSCERNCYEMFAKGQLKKGIGYDDCVKITCK